MFGKANYREDKIKQLFGYLNMNGRMFHKLNI